MLPKSATRARKRNKPRPDEKSAPSFLQWLRGRPCACAGRNPSYRGRIQAAHGPDKATKGMGTKVSDKHSMPLSTICHAAQHNLGWPPFAERYLGGRDPLEVCADYWRAWSGRLAWEKKIGIEYDYKNCR